jgi:periplasmic protein TonB
MTMERAFTPCVAASLLMHAGVLLYAPSAEPLSLDDDGDRRMIVFFGTTEPPKMEAQSNSSPEVVLLPQTPPAPEITDVPKSPAPPVVHPEKPAIMELPVPKYDIAAPPRHETAILPVTEPIEPSFEPMEPEAVPLPRVDLELPSKPRHAPRLEIAPPPMPQSEPSANEKPGEPERGQAVAEEERAVYLAEIARRVQQAKRYPFGARRARLEGTVVLSFVLNGDGGLKALRQRQGSGHALLDKAAVEIVRRGAPYPRIPPSLEVSEYSITIPIRFSLED